MDVEKDGKKENSQIAKTTPKNFGQNLFG